MNFKHISAGLPMWEKDVRKVVFKLETLFWCKTRDKDAKIRFLYWCTFRYKSIYLYLEWMFVSSWCVITTLFDWAVHVSSNRTCVDDVTISSNVFTNVSIGTSIVYCKIQMKERYDYHRPLCADGAQNVSSGNILRLISVCQKMWFYKFYNSQEY